MDFSVPGGTDKEGWQYAADFPTYEESASSNVFFCVFNEKVINPFV